jgi:hypothetical protein
MLRVTPLLFLTLLVAVVTLSTASFVKEANGCDNCFQVPPTGVPINAPLTCSTANFTISAMTGPNDEFPIIGTWSDGSGLYAKYQYKITSTTGKFVDYTLIMVPADQYLGSADPLSDLCIPGALGAADPQTNVGGGLYHEYPVGFDPPGRANPYTFTLYMNGPSTAEPTTVVVKYGLKKEACSIAGPGNAVNAFMPTTTSQSATGAGGKCVVTLSYGPNNELIGLATSTSGCYSGQGDLTISGQSENSSSGTATFVGGPVTFGNQTTTCWPAKPKPWCVCTSQPCP